MITNADKRDSWGTGTLVGPRHILTAAHVIEQVGAREKNGCGRAVFVLPQQGTESLIVKAELDGGWKHKLVSFDIAICTLDTPLAGALGYAELSVFEDSLFRSNMNLTGYDHDCSTSATSSPPLVTRAGEVARTPRYTGELAVKGAIAGSNLGSFLDGGANFLSKPGDKTLKQRAVGRTNSVILGLAGGAAGGLCGIVLDDEGWVSQNMGGTAGVDGAPIWIDKETGPVVVGVQSVLWDPTQLVSDRGMGGGLACGSRITAGPCENMIRDHIKRNP